MPVEHEPPAAMDRQARPRNVKKRVAAGVAGIVGFGAATVAAILPSEGSDAKGAQVVALASPHPDTSPQLKLTPGLDHNPLFARWVDTEYLLSVERANAIKTWDRAAWFATVAQNAETKQIDWAFLDCTMGHESLTSGGYHAISPSGIYFGAFQFNRETWDNTAYHAGRPDLAGVRPDLASPMDQNILANDLHAWQGAAPWGGRCAGL